MEPSGVAAAAFLLGPAGDSGGADRRRSRTNLGLWYLALCSVIRNRPRYTTERQSQYHSEENTPDGNVTYAYMNMQTPGTQSGSSIGSRVDPTAVVLYFVLEGRRKKNVRGRIWKRKITKGPR